MPFEWKFYNLAENKAVGALEIIQKKVLECAFCKGQGSVYGGICPICSGRGKKNVHPPLISCRRCNGWGSYPMNSQSPCMTCKGVGAVSVRLPIVTCRECYGRGDTTSGLMCTKCGGRGVVTNYGAKDDLKKQEKMLSNTTILIRKVGK